MAKMAKWYKDLKTELEKTIEYKIESKAFKIAVQVYNRSRELGLTQKELAKRLNVSKSYVSQILQGKTNMTIETIIKLGDVLGLIPEINLIPKVEDAGFKLIDKKRLIFEKTSFSNYATMPSHIRGALEDLSSRELETLTVVKYDDAVNTNVKVPSGV